VASDLILTPQGPFSLRAAAGFGFGPHAARAGADEGLLRLSFPVDGGTGYAGVVARQALDDEPVQLEVQGDGDPAAVRRQVARILSLDHDGDAFMSVGEAEPVLGRLQREHPGQRPVLFHSPYEAAAWAIISVRRQPAQATRTRVALAQRLGRTFELAGEPVAAFPQPERLLELEPMPGLEGERVTRLQGVARAALAGDLEAGHLLALGPDAALEQMRALRGIGPFYAGLVVVRATGFADAMLAVAEPKLLGHAGRLYGRDRPLTLEELITLAERWRPFRTWAMVLVRLAGDRARA
jgi:DNA-3-methyladenine glycosylase II